MTTTTATLSLGRRTDAAAHAGFREIDGRPVMWCEVAGGPHHGAITFAGGAALARAVELAVEVRIPVVFRIDSSGAEITEGVAALHAWGGVARALARASGVVPTAVIVTGACLSGPSLLLGIVDAVVMTDTAFAFLSGPEMVAEFTGVAVDRVGLGGAGMHESRSGVATIVVEDTDAASEAVAMLLSYLPSHALARPAESDDAADPVGRPCTVASHIVPDSPTAAYDMFELLDDVCDTDSLCEIRAHYAPNVITAFARVGGIPVGIVANQPAQRAGTLDIEASRKAARFVSWCDAFDLPIVTFVDTPGFEPGKDLEWRGMIRHGAELVHAYCEATVPRVCVIVRKAFGGAYIVMDSRGIGNDVCVAWPTAEIAVMGASGAVQILGNKGVTANAYGEVFLNPYRAAERGLVDAVIDPIDTRRVVAAALRRIGSKRRVGQSRKHSNSPQ